MAAGAPRTNSRTGSVSVRRLIDGTWDELGQTLVGAAANDDFGRKVSLNAAGNVLAVGSRTASAIGNVKLYKLKRGVWVQLGSTLTGGAPGDEFGNSVALNASGNIVAIASYEANIDAGNVKLYKLKRGVWVQLGATLSGASVGDLFGYSVALNAAGTVVTVGAIGSGSNAGAVSVYKFSRGAWRQLGATLTGASANQWFGYSVSSSASGTTVTVGAELASSVLVYRYSKGSWQQVGSTLNNVGGFSVNSNASGNQIVVGDPTYNAEAGAVRVFRNSGGAWQQVGSTITGSLAGNQVGSSVSGNSSGSVITIGASGRSSNNIGYVQQYRFNR